MGQTPLKNPLDDLFLDYPALIKLIKRCGPKRKTGTGIPLSKPPDCGSRALTTGFGVKIGPFVVGKRNGGGPRCRTNDNRSVPPSRRCGGVNIIAIRENTDRILQLLESEDRSAEGS
jgi:hypothetical protein